MSEQGKFEDEWKGTFEGVELAPSKNVWSNIWAEVATDQAQRQSKRAVYWRWMAAASIALLLGVGVSSFYAYQSVLEKFKTLSKQEQVLLQDIAMMEEDKCIEEEIFNHSNQQASLAFASKNERVNENDNSKDVLKDNEEIAIVHVPQNIELLSNTTERISTIDNHSDDKVNSPLIPFADETISNISNTIPLAIADNITEGNKSTKSTSAKLIDPISLIRLEPGLLASVQNNIEPQKVPNMIEIIKMQNGSKKEYKGMWVGLSLGGGSYESNINQGRSDSFSLADGIMIEGVSVEGNSKLFNSNDINQTNIETPEFSYAVSANFGKQIGRKTFLQGGVEYNKYSSGSTSNIVTTNADNSQEAFIRLNNSAEFDNESLTVTDTYELKNNFQYVAIPLRMGYKLLDKKIGISLSSGVSTNLFLKNTLKDKSGNVNQTEVTNGIESPYKPLSFNGLFGGEITYQWNEHYQLALVPDYRFSLDGVTKADTFIQSKPTAFFLGFSFKYILK